MSHLRHRPGSESNLSFDWFEDGHGHDDDEDDDDYVDDDDDNDENDDDDDNDNDNDDNDENDDDVNYDAAGQPLIGEHNLLATAFPACS